MPKITEMKIIIKLKWWVVPLVKTILFLSMVIYIEDLESKVYNIIRNGIKIN